MWDIQNLLVGSSQIVFSVVWFLSCFIIILFQARKVWTFCFQIFEVRTKIWTHCQIQLLLIVICIFLRLFLCFLSVFGYRYLPVLYCDHTNGGWWDNTKCHHNICHDKKCHNQRNWCSIGSLHGNQLPHTNCLPHPGEYYVQELWMAFIWCIRTCRECSCCTVFISSRKRLILDKTNMILSYFNLNNKLTPYRWPPSRQYWVQTFDIKIIAKEFFNNFPSY